MSKPHWEIGGGHYSLFEHCKFTDWDEEQLYLILEPFNDKIHSSMIDSFMNLYGFDSYAFEFYQPPDEEEKMVALIFTQKEETDE